MNLTYINIQSCALTAFTLLLALSSSASTPESGKAFSDCETCPVMIVVPAGSFEMGDREGDGHPREKPVHLVDIGQPYAVGKFEITFEEWDQCVDAGGCDYRPTDKNMGRGKRPVDLISWEDTQDYVEWLSRFTGETYRLLSEAEWEYARRAGTNTLFSWGNELGSGNANCAYCEVKGLPQMIPVGSFPPNPFNIHDMVCGVNEWIEDCEHENYDKAPRDGSAWLADGNCSRRGVRGGSIYETERFQLPAVRNFRAATERSEYIGFRVARSL